MGVILSLSALNLQEQTVKLQNIQTDIQQQQTDIQTRQVDMQEISIEIQKQQVNIQKQQFEMEQMLNSPMFNMLSQEYTTSKIINGNIYPSCIEYIISNNGGNIYDAHLSAELRVDYIIIDNKDNEEIGDVSTRMLEQYIESFSNYDPNKKSFSIYEKYIDEFHGNGLYHSLMHRFEDYFNDYTIIIEDNYYININYKDIMQKKHSEWYVLYGMNSMQRVNPPKKSQPDLFIDRESMTEDEIYNIIVEKVENIIEDH